MSKQLTVLILGDVFGKPGVRALYVGLKTLRKEYKADLVITNGENADDGLGITPEQMEQLFSCGVDAITSGNHIWHRREILEHLDSQRPIIRPANYPPAAPGRGDTFVEVKGTEVGILNLQGRQRLSTLDCPFRVGKEAVKRMRERCATVIVDFHAEEPEEKEALAFYLDGTVSAVVGTHTHVQTADERVLPGGTAYISDIGMTGPAQSVIGSSKEVSMRRSLTQMPLKMEVSQTPAVIHGIKLTLDTESGHALSIERIRKESLV